MFAVPTPWGVDVSERLFVRSQNLLNPVVSNNHLVYILRSVLRNGIGLDMSLDLFVSGVLEESFETVQSELSLEVEFVVVSIIKEKMRGGVDAYSKILCKSVCQSFLVLGIRNRNEDSRVLVVEFINDGFGSVRLLTHFGDENDSFVLRFQESLRIFSAEDFD